MSDQSLSQKLLRSTGASVFSLGLRILLTLGAEFVLRRFVPPEEWGLFKWAVPVFLIVGALRDLGLAYHVLRVEPRPYGNLLRLELIWGGALVVLSFFLAPFAHLIYTENPPQLVLVLQCLSLFMFFEGLSTVPRVYLEGELSVGRAVVPELLRNLCFVVLSISLAVLGHGVWSLVIAHVTAAGLYALLLWRKVWGEIPLVLHKEGTFALIKQSLPLAATWLLILLTRYVDPLILGLRFPSEVLGFYNFAYEWATILSIMILLPALGRTLFPALVRYAGRQDEMFRVFSLATLLVAAIEVPAAFFLFLNAEMVVQIVGGEQWVEAVPQYLRILCFAPLIEPMSRLGGEVLKALHRESWWIAATLVTALTYGLGGYWLTGTMGPIGMAWINLAPMGAIVMAWALHRVSPSGFWRLMRDLSFIYVIPVPLFAAVYWLVGDRPIPCFIASIMAAILSLAVVVWRFGKDFITFFKPPPPPSSKGPQAATAAAA